jgi:hypothetical protein
MKDTITADLKDVDMLTGFVVLNILILYSRLCIIESVGFNITGSTNTHKQDLKPSWQINALKLSCTILNLSHKLTYWTPALSIIRVKS